MAQTTPKNSGYTIINGSTTGSNGSKVNTWIEYKVTAQSIENNTSTIDIYLYARANTAGLSTAWQYNNTYGSISLDGTAHAGPALTNGYDFRSTSIYNQMAHYTTTVTHNANGSKTIALAGSWNKGTSSSTYITGGSVPSTSVTLPTIPQYASVTQTLDSKTETSIVIKWVSDQTVNFVQYSTDDGTTWVNVGSVNATSGSYSITGLTANTAYKVKTSVRNKASMLWSDTTTLNVTTYNYPYASSMPSFTIGDKVTIGFTNPLGRTFTFTVVVGSAITNTWTISGTSYSGLDGSSTVTQLYAKIPNTTGATYSIKCTYDGHTVTKTGGMVSANANVCGPSITALTYADTNSTVQSVLQDSSQILQNLSVPRYTATGISGNYSATIATVAVTVNGATYAMTISGSTATVTGGTIDSAQDVTATVAVTDSRGIRTTATVNVDMLAWSTPSALITLGRVNNFYTETNITVDATYDYVDGKNNITIQYRIKKVSDGSYGAWATIPDNTQTTFNADNLYEWNVQVKLTDSFGGTATYNLKLAKGMPLWYIDTLRSSIGVNCFPQDNQSLYVDGYNLLNSLVYKGTLTSSDDLDNVTDTGIYYITSSVPSNAPDGATTYSTVLVIHPVGSFYQQIYVRPRLTQGLTQISVRQYSGSPPTWSIWQAVNDMPFAKGIRQITANSDLNSFTETGVYYCSTSADTQSLSNSPYTEGVWIDGTTGFRLEVYSTTGAGYGLQILYTHNVIQRTYIRALNGSTWRAWHRIVGDDEIYYRNNDTLSITTYTDLNGFITSSTTSVSFSFYTPKSLANIASVRVTAFKGTMRGGSGYLNSQSSAYDWLADSAYTITATIISDNMLRIVCTKSSAYTNVTNNTPVSYYGSLGLSFSTT